MTVNYQTSAGVKYHLTAHLVWCSKYRRAVLTEDVKERLVELIHDISREKHWDIISLEVMQDHVHVLVSYDPKSSIAYVANQLKGRSSHVLREEYPHLRSLLSTLWSRSYFTSSMGVNEEIIREYIDTQYERPWRKE